MWWRSPLRCRSDCVSAESSVLSSPAARPSRRTCGPGGVARRSSALPAAGVAGGLVGWPTMQLRDAGLLAATVAAIGAAVLCMMIFVGLVFLVDRSLGAALWHLVRRRNVAADRS